MALSTLLGHGLPFVRFSVTTVMAHTDQDDAELELGEVMSIPAWSHSCGQAPQGSSVSSLLFGRIP